jgi:membrane-associated phospholipid phosphatase
MLETLDLTLFYIGNQTLANPVFDVVMPFITANVNIVPVLLALVIGIIWRGNVRDQLMLLLAILLIVLADQSAGLWKGAFMRPRPCQTLAEDAVRLLIPCGTGKSFPSNHAANNFAVATLLLMVYGSKMWWMLIWASLVSYSRVYCGVHYVSDIVAGALWGTLLAFALVRAWRLAFAGNRYLRL